MTPPYHIKEIYYTLQGEGAQVGRPAVFCRFTGCNLWSGREENRETAICSFCDTDFVGTDGSGGGVFESVAQLAAAIESAWLPSKKESCSQTQRPARFVVCTGGEPLLQLDAPLIEALQRLDFEVAVETNGALAAPTQLDWICVSPKAGAEWVQKSGDEIKLVYPQPGAMPEQFIDGQFAHWYLQPMDGTHRQRNTAAAIEYCLANPKWKLSVQTHKLIGIQ